MRARTPTKVVSKAVDGQAGKMRRNEGVDGNMGYTDIRRGYLYA